MDDDVQALDPISHINGGGISFVVPDPDLNSGLAGKINYYSSVKVNYSQFKFVKVEH